MCDGADATDEFGGGVGSIFKIFLNIRAWRALCFPVYVFVAIAEMDFDEESSSEMLFDKDSSLEAEFDEDAVDFDGNDTNVYFIVKPFDDAAKKAELILNNTHARMKKQDKGPTTELETAYLATLKSKLAEIFKLGYDLISAKCKRDDLGRHVYEPQPMVGPASKSVGCYKVLQVARGNNKGRVKTGWVIHLYMHVL